MDIVLISLLALTMLAVLGSLGAGLFVMARGKQGDAKLSNRLMTARVVFQAAAVICFVLLVIVSTQG